LKFRVIGDHDRMAFRGHGMMVSIRRWRRLLMKFCGDVIRAMIWSITWLHQVRVVLGVHGVLWWMRSRCRLRNNSLRLWNGNRSERHTRLGLIEIGIWGLCLGIEWLLREEILI
jgi:hypothetical protein